MTTFWLTSSDPLHDAEDFRRYRDAVERMNEIVAELEAEGYTCDCGLASARNMYAMRATKPGCKAITYEVNDDNHNDVLDEEPGP